MGNEPLGPKPVWGGGAGGALLPPWAPRAWRLPGPGTRWRGPALWGLPQRQPWWDKWWRGPEPPPGVRLQLHMVRGPDGALDLVRMQDAEHRSPCFCLFDCLVGGAGDAGLRSGSRRCAMCATSRGPWAARRPSGTSRRLERGQGGKKTTTLRMMMVKIVKMMLMVAVMMMIIAK